MARGSTGTNPRSGSESCGVQAALPGWMDVLTVGVEGETQAELGLVCGGSWAAPSPFLGPPVLPRHTLSPGEAGPWLCPVHPRPPA